MSAQFTKNCGFYSYLCAILFNFNSIFRKDSWDIFALFNYLIKSIYETN